MVQENVIKDQNLRLKTPILTVRKIVKNQFSVDSETDSTKSYRVTKLAKKDIWVCECKDFHDRLRRDDDNKHCKHIQNCILFPDDQEDKPIQTIVNVCPSPVCLSTEIVKNGFRILKDNVKRQKYRCVQCKYRFILGENGFAKMSTDPKIVSESLNLVMSGMSYRNIARHIKITHNIKISHVSINNWVKKFTQLIKRYLESLYPELGNVWSVDEMALNVKNTEKTGKGHYVWLWTIIDPKTRFVISTIISKRREIKDAQKILASGKNKVLQNPDYILTDSLRAYKKAIMKEFQNQVAWVKTKSIKDGFVNRPIERYHNELRPNTKSRRGLGNDESAQTFMELCQINHNFVKPHMGLNGKTPAQEAGIELNLGHDKYRDLIRLASTKPNFVTNLGKRIEHLKISNEKDSIRISTRHWIDKKIWREINDILRLHKFSWLSNGKDSCWLKMNN